MRWVSNSVQLFECKLPLAHFAPNLLEATRLAGKPNKSTDDFHAPPDQRHDIVPGAEPVQLQYLSTQGIDSSFQKDPESLYS